MATPAVFDATSCPPLLTYDFTGFMRSDGTGACKGKGVIPEPPSEVLCDFLSVAKHLESAPLPGRTGSVIMTKRVEGARADMVGALSDLAGPTKSELEELPLRALVAFFRELVGQLEVVRVVGL